MQLWPALPCLNMWVKILGYSETQAAERVNSVRLMRAIPEVEAKIKTGSLSMTTASLVQRHLKQEKRAGNSLSQTAALELIESCSGQSKRDVEKTLLSQASAEAKGMREKVREVTPQLTELKFFIPESTFQKLSEVKNLIGNESLQEIFDQGLDALIHESQKKKGRVKVSDKIKDPIKDKEETVHERSEMVKPTSSTLPAKEEATIPTPPSSYRSRFISIHTKRIISARSGDQCEHVDPKSKIRCTSRHLLELDHIHPYALGGSNEASNLRFTCRTHNLKAAMEAGFDVHPRPKH